MNTAIRLLFPAYSGGNAARLSWLLLSFRVLFGVLLMSHGIGKIMDFDNLSAVFPDPLGVGREMSLSLAIFGEVVCSVGFILGLLYRLALIPMMFIMATALFVIHAGDTFAVKELAFTFLCVFIIMWIAGPGKYSADYLISRRLPAH